MSVGDADARLQVRHEGSDYRRVEVITGRRKRRSRTAREKAAVVSFTVEGIHPHDIGTILDGFGVAIRAGHHCAQPLMRRYGLPSTARASFYLYNTREEVDTLVQAIHHVRHVFA